MARIRVINEDEAEGRLKEIYDGLTKSRGKLAAVHKIQSLRPESIVKHMELYMEVMFSRSELSRAEREMMAVVVSRVNRCSYCQIHHSEALNHYWKNEDKIASLKRDYKSTQLSERETALCAFSAKLTSDPGSSLDHDLTTPLRELGISDSGILDATLVISYFNFVNRMVLGLGVHLESDAGKDYRY